MHRFFRTVGYARVESDREAREILEDMLLRCRDAVHHIAMRNGARLQDQVGQSEIIPPANCNEKIFGGVD